MTGRLVMQPCIFHGPTFTRFDRFLEQVQRDHKEKRAFTPRYWAVNRLASDSSQPYTLRSPCGLKLAVEQLQTLGNEPNSKERASCKLRRSCLTYINSKAFQYVQFQPCKLPCFDADSNNYTHKHNRHYKAHSCKLGSTATRHNPRMIFRLNQ